MDQGNELTAIDFDGTILNVNTVDRSGMGYAGRPHYEEFHSLFYTAVQDALAPEVALDIGANYGLITMIMARNFPDARLIAVEPAQATCRVLEKNMRDNGFADRVQLVRAFISSEARRDQDFAFNPAISQDSRVVKPGPAWAIEKVDSISGDEILAPWIDKRKFIKIDTQGFERKVFKGLEKTLSANSSWLIKSEFAPFCLRSQGTDPVELLHYLIGRYRVSEMIERSRFGQDSIPQLLGRTLAADEAADFVAYVEGLNRRRNGWLDILVAPKDAP